MLEAIAIAIQRVFGLWIAAGVVAVALALGMSQAAIEWGGGSEGVAGSIEEADREVKDREIV